MNTEIDDERMAEWNELRDLVRIAGSLDCGSGIAGKIEKLERMADRVTRDDLRNCRPSLLFIIGEMLKEKYCERENL